MISHPLNDDPWHKPVELCFYKAGSDFLYFESVDQPLRDIEQEEESRDLATGFFISKTLGKNLKYDTFECFTFSVKIKCQISCFTSCFEKGTLTYY